MNKTKRKTKTHAECTFFDICDEILEQVEYTYPGQMVNGDPNYKKHIRRRKGMGWRAFAKHSTLMKSLSLKKCTQPMHLACDDI